jgi:hypothetical protein
MPEDMDSHPINEWIAGELARIKEQLVASERNLQDLIERHVIVVDNYARVCNQNDRLRAAGEDLRTLLIEHETITDPRVDEALKKWGNAHV